MVQYCVAYGCKNLHDKRIPNVQFHSFPFKRPEILQLWITAIKRDHWKPSRTSRLCSAHFKETDYQDRPGLQKKILKLDAVPSIFNFPKHLLQQNTKARRVLIRKQINCIQDQDQKTENMECGSSEQASNMLDAQTQTETKYVLASDYILKRKLKTLKQKLKRKEMKIKSMEHLIETLKENNCTNASLTSVMENYFKGFPLELLINQHKNETIAPGRRRYSDLMKQFAHTMYFYSPKAYRFLRQYFVLPTGRTIRKWLSSLDCFPGLLSEVFAFLKKEVEQQQDLKDCALIVDGMSIRKQIIWDDSKGKFVGYIDYGGIVDPDYDSPASEALFLQIVSYRSNLKLPVAYFLTNKTNADIQTQIITCCLRKLWDVGIVIRSITSDGTTTNIQTFKQLTGSDLHDISYFYHPCVADVKVYCILDICHMLKLARNCMAEKIILSETGTIHWTFIKKLHERQNKEELRLGNALTSAHVNYKNKIMNVRLAAQALSSRVANALSYLKDKGDLDFRECAATVKFIRTIDKIFDILNVRNPFGKGYKSPIRPETLPYFKEIFSEAIHYLENLKIEDVLILDHPRKTFALGFILTMKSTLGLAQDLFNLEHNPLQYFLSYKCSQDHLEIFFSCIRGRGGWNNNPNTSQLRWALRQLLLRNSIEASVSANCMNFGSACTPTFEFRNEHRRIISDDTNEEETFDFQVLDKISESNLSEFQENVLYYIAGFIVRKLVKNTLCSDCINILLFRNDFIQSDHMYCRSSNESFKQFTTFASNGGLVYASDIVYKIIQFAEKHYRILKNSGSLMQSSVKNILRNAAVQKFASNLEVFQPTHPAAEELISEDVHEIQLIKGIVNQFLKCRMPHHAKLCNESFQKTKLGLRQKLTKLILFNNQ